MEYRSNMDKVIGKLRDLLGENTLDKLYLSIAQSIYASNLRRIHTDGKAVSGSNIGRYSTTPMYVNPARSPRAFAPMGKNGSRNRRTRYFPGGYREFRSTIGKESGKVNLQLNGTLLSDFQLRKIYNGYALGFMTAKSSKIASGMENKYAKKIWGISSQDRTDIDNITREYFNAKP
jgi:hypothetical protein